MRLSAFFMPVLKEPPKDAEIISHRLMLQSGMIRQQASGIYSWLPLGYRVLNNIEKIIREEQNRIKALQMLMPTIQPAKIWQKSGRYDNYGKEMLRITDRHGRKMLYGPTNEEMVTEIFKAYVHSHRDLPLNLYQIQWKFRDEIRPRFGVMRGREFLMKDAYSFDLDYQKAIHSYNKMLVAYLRTFYRLGLQALPMQADSGPIGGDTSHEFIVLAPTGETSVFYDKRLLDVPIPSANTDFDVDLTQIVKAWTSPYAATDDKHNEDIFNKLPAELQTTAKGIEVGHTFYFGIKYSLPMDATVANPSGIDVPVHMGSYGIGVSRLVAAIIEAHHDEKGIVWPTAVAPFIVNLLNLNPEKEHTLSLCNEIYAHLRTANLNVLYDDTEARAGVKLATADLMGAPWQLIVGTMTAANSTVELKYRPTGEKHTLSLNAAVSKLIQYCVKSILT